jgi:hypothetical protein
VRPIAPSAQNRILNSRPPASAGGLFLPLNPPRQGMGLADRQNDCFGKLIPTIFERPTLGASLWPGWDSTRRVFICRINKKHGCRLPQKGRCDSGANHRSCSANHEAHRAQPSSREPGVRNPELSPAAIETNCYVGRWGHGRVAEGAVTVAVEPDFGGNGR